MTMNKALFDVLNDPELLNRPGYEEALDALIKAPDPTAFRRSLLDNKSFWHGIGKLQISTHDKDDNNFLDTTIYRDIRTLYDLAVYRRVKLGLKKASITVIQEIASAQTFDAARQAIEGKADLGPFNTKDLSSWDYTKDNYITNPCAAQIGLDAMQQLLLNAVIQSDDDKSIQKLLDANITQTDVIATAQSLGIPNQIAGRMAQTTLFPIKSDITLRLHEIRLKKLTDMDVLKQHKTIRKNSADIKKDLTFGTNLTDNDLKKAHALYGMRFLTLKLANDSLTPAELTLIASTTDTKSMQSVLSGLNEVKGGYIEHTVTDTTLSDIRKTAAKHALRNSIEQSTDTPALKALSEAKTTDDVKKVLEQHPSLGFTKQPNFTSALTGLTPDDITDIVGAAHVQQSLGNADSTKFAALLNADTLASVYGSQFSTAGTPFPTNLTSYLHNPSNALNIRQRAFVGVAKTVLDKLDNETLDQLIEAPSVDDLKAAAKTLLNNNHANDLFTDQPTDTGFISQFRAYAAIEKAIRASKTNKQQDLLRLINDPTNIPNIALIKTLPKADQDAFSISLVESFIDQFVGAKAAEALYNNQDDKAFIAELNKIGINQTDWVNQPALKERVQKAAMLKSLKLAIETQLPFDSTARPELLTLLSSLPVDKQKALLKKPEVLRTLANASNVQEVERALDDKTLTIRNDLFNENQQLNRIAQIYNPEIAQRIAGLKPPVALTEKMINDINHHILTAKSPYDYGREIKNINNAIFTNDNAAFYNAFGLDANASNVTDQAIQDAITGQHEFNKILIDTFKKDKNPILSLFLTIKKTSAFTSYKQITQLTKDFNDAENIETFTKKANNKGSANSYATLLADSWEKHLTPQRFQSLKAQTNQHQLSPTSDYEAILDRYSKEMRELKTISDKLSGVQNDIKKELETLSKQKIIHWFNPAFQARAQQNAYQMADHFKELAKGCDTTIAHFRRQLHVANEQLKSLPNDPTIQDQTFLDAIKKRREQLETLINDLETHLTSYDAVEKALHGDPNASNPLIKQGILVTLEQAKAGKGDVKPHDDLFNTTFTDYPNTKLNERLKSTLATPDPAKARPSHTTLRASGAQPSAYEAIDRVPEGHFREHTISTTVGSEVVDGRIIEERGATTTEINPKTQQMESSSNLKLTLVDFPKDTASGADATVARINTAMEMAMKLVRSRGAPPTKDKPFIIEGSNQLEVEYLFSALLMIGKNDPNFKFDASAIKTDSCNFTPQVKKFFFISKTNEACYKNTFKNSPEAKKALEGLKAFNRDKFSHQSLHTSASKIIQSINKVFKKDYQDELDKVDDQIQDKENQTRPTLKT